jgi:hypothetical protein
VIVKIIFWSDFYTQNRCKRPIPPSYLTLPDWHCFIQTPTVSSPTFQTHHFSLHQQILFSQIFIVVSRGSRSSRSYPYDMQTPESRFHLRSPTSLRFTPYQRPSRLLTGLRAAAQSAPYAYSGHYHLHGKGRPGTPPTPTPPPRTTSDTVPGSQFSIEDVSAGDATTTPQTKSIHNLSNDPVDFSLYDAQEGKYRLPSTEEFEALRKAFPSAVDFQFRWPLIIVHCSEPPEEVPLTIGGVPAIFLPENDQYDPFPGTPGHPRIADYMAKQPYDSKVENKFNFCRRVIEALSENKLSPISVTFYLGVLVIELKDEIPPSSLPGRLAGVVPFYCNGKAAWTNQIRQSRLITLTQGSVDLTNYSSAGLTPGTRVCGEAFAGTSGLMLRNSVTGERRVMVAGHVFPDTDNVYHPTTSSENKIGTITHRYRDIDVALFELLEGMKYDNSSYFEAPVAKKLLTRDYDGNPGQEWFFIDSPFIGLVPLLWTGVRVGIREDLPQAFHTLQHDEQYVFLSMQMNVGKLSNGVCGSPIVHDDWESESESDGAVLGIFSWSDPNIIENLFVNVMDQVVHDGWEVERGQ